MATETMTQATPMTTPSAVSSERILFRAIDFKPTMVMLPRRVRELRMGLSRHWCDRRGNALPLDPMLLDPFVLLNHAVAHVHDPFRVLGDVRLVGDEHDGFAFVVQ